MENLPTLHGKRRDHKQLTGVHSKSIPMAHGEGNCCCCSSEVGGAVQSLEEVEFGRSLAGAAHAGDLSKMKQLLDKGACVEGGSDAGYTPLNYAARNGHLDACRLLLQHGAEVDARTRAGKATSLHRAAYAGHQRIVQLLLENGADPCALDSDGHTPLRKAAMQGHTGIVGVLIKATPDAAS